MPEYFFHIGLELISDTKHSSLEHSLAPVNLTQAFKALRPFLRSTHPRSKRNSQFDTKPAASRTVIEKIPEASAFTKSTDRAALSSSDDHRADRVRLECVDMEPSQGSEKNRHNSNNHIEKGIGTAISSVQTKGRYTPTVQEPACEEWGIVHLYRDAAETPGLYRDSPVLGPDLWNAGSGAARVQPAKPNPPPKDEDCTTLCILAVPSYFTPADFLAFVGEETRENVSHFRMIKTSRANRYMVLMKFNNGKKARDWQHEWNGKVFNSMEPETCHVVFLKSVEIMQPHTSPYEDASSPAYDGTRTFPKMSNDPFAAPSPSSKPLAPRTPALVELPTCPVCLERMDETTGLLTILCQHVFHCTCLEKWSGGGCPVCRYTHDDFSTKVGSHKHKSKIYASEYEVTDEPLECEECHTEDNLWQCLICGKVGCGRYGGKHAYKHYEATGHAFSMDLVNKRVWDYAADVYVHRIIQDATNPGEKLVELPGRRREGATTALEADEDIEVAKLENVALEYTHLLTSQLESQRVYFEEIVERAVDKASQAVKQADRAVADCVLMRDQVQKMTLERDNLVNRTLPEAEDQKKRLEKRSSKYEEEAKSAKTKYLEEKSVATSLLERIKHLEDTHIADLQKRIKELEEDNATQVLLMEGLQEEHRDAMIQISAQEKLRAMVKSGELNEEDLVGATIEAGPTANSTQRRANTADAATSLRGQQALEDPLGEILMSTFLPNPRFQLSPSWSSQGAGEVVDELKKSLNLSSMSRIQISNAYITALTSAGLLVNNAHGEPYSYAKVKVPLVGDSWCDEILEELDGMDGEETDRASIDKFRARVTKLEQAGLLVRTSRPTPPTTTDSGAAEVEIVATPSKPKKKKGKGKKK